MCFRAGMIAVQTDITVREAGAGEQRELSGAEQCRLPAPEEQRGWGGGRELSAGKGPRTSSLKCTTPQPILAQASHQAKVGPLQLVGSGSSRTPLGTQQEWLGGLQRLEWCFAHRGRGHGSRSRASPISEDEGQAPGSI